MLLLPLFWLSFAAATSTVQAGRRMHNIYWNTTNPMFRIDNTDNIIDINIDNLAWEYDQANIICPRYRTGTRSADVERYVIYNVSRDEYENCRIIQPNPRVIAVCDKPHDLMYFTITFRSFTPTPGGLEFRPGQDYYFISTSSRSDLYRRLGGRCTTHNMRVVFKVADTKVDTSTVSSNNVNKPRAGSELVETVTKTVIRSDNDHLDSENEAATKLSDFHSYLYPMRDIIELGSNSVEHDKRSEDYENHANEVVKQEASVMHSSSEAKTINLVVTAFCSLLLLLR